MTTAEAVQVITRARAARQARSLLVIVVLAVVVFGTFCVSLPLGDFKIPVIDVVKTLFGGGDRATEFIVNQLRLPRALTGLLVGAALGMSGAIFQSIARNPLASPDIIGVSLGASAAAVSVIALAGWTGWPVSAAAVVGALTVALAVRAVAGDRGGFRLVLAGIGLAAAMQSVIQYVFTRVDEYDVQLVLRWLTGSVNGVAWQAIGLLALALAVLLPATGWAARSLRATELGDDTAAGLGVGRGRTDVLMLLGVLLVAVAVAAAGPVAFVAFLSGPIARVLNRGRTTLAAAGLVGAVIVLAGDYAGAYAFADLNLPVGVVTGAFGAPFLLWLLARGPLNAHRGRRAG